MGLGVCLKQLVETAHGLEEVILAKGKQRCDCIPGLLGNPKVGLTQYKKYSGQWERRIWKSKMCIHSNKSLGSGELPEFF